MDFLSWVVDYVATIFATQSGLELFFTVLAHVLAGGSLAAVIETAPARAAPTRPATAAGTRRRSDRVIRGIGTAASMTIFPESGV